MAYFLTYFFYLGTACEPSHEWPPCWGCVCHYFVLSPILANSFSIGFYSFSGKNNNTNPSSFHTCLKSKPQTRTILMHTWHKTCRLHCLQMVCINMFVCSSGVLASHCLWLVSSLNKTWWFQWGGQLYSSIRISY